MGEAKRRRDAGEIPTKTDAMDRAQRFLGGLTRDDMDKLRRIDAAKAAGMVLNADKHKIPFEPGKIAMSLEFGAASIRWNSAPVEFIEMHDQIAAGFNAQHLPRDQWRQVAREGIAQMMYADRHMDIAEGSLCAMLACFLMLDRGQEVGLTLRAFALAGRLKHAGYVITQTEAPTDKKAPWGALNFRLIAGE